MLRDTDWCWLILIDADWFWLTISDGDWWWLMLIDFDLCWLTNKTKSHLLKRSDGLWRFACGDNGQSWNRMCVQSNIYWTGLIMWTFALCCLWACRVLKIFQIYSKDLEVLLQMAHSRYRFLINLFGVVFYVAQKEFMTWKFYCRDCREWRFLQDDLLQCDLLCFAQSLPFHTLCKHQQSDFRLQFCSDFSPSSTWSFLPSCQE